MSMLVDSIAIGLQCCPHFSAARSLLPPPEVLQVDRLCRLIAQAVKNCIGVHQSLYPFLSAIKKQCLIEVNWNVLGV